jgi:predicted transcriptional regulator
VKKEMTLTIDTAGEGLAMVLKDYQEEALKYLWRLNGDGASSRDVWVQVNKDLEGRRTISRASIINFLNSMVDEGVLNYIETTGKGGHRRIYSAKYDEAEFKQFVAETVLKNLMRDFPDETMKALQSVK